MKKLLSFCMFALVVVVIAVACSDGGTSTPVAPTVDNASVTNVTDARRNVSPVLLCHHQKGDTPAWEVIEVDNNSRKYDGHLRHGDYTTTSCSTLSSLDVGDNCTCCLTNTCGSI